MTSKSFRLANLKLLVKEFGTIAAVAAAGNTSEKYLWQVLNEVPLKSGNPRGLGDVVARRIEVGCMKPKGWLDIDRSNGATSDAIRISPIEAELLRLFRSASEPHRRTILAVARLNVVS